VDDRPAILFLPHRIPYPPRKGDKIRAFHWLQGLSRHYRVFLASFVDDEADWQYVSALNEFCEQSYVAGINNRHAYYAGLKALLTGESITTTYYHNSSVQQWVDQTVVEHGIERIVVFSSSMAQFVMGKTYETKTRVMDFVDTDSDKWRQYADFSGWPMSWVYKREAHLLSQYEKRVFETFDWSVLVSDEEVAVFRETVLKGGVVKNLSSIANGVDGEYFSVSDCGPSPYAKAEQVIVFTGTLDYWPNIDAVEWFVQNVFVDIKRQQPEVCFYIVGAKPVKRVMQLAETAGVMVVANVKDIRPYLQYAAVAVAPMRVGRGIQNKVLEALASGLPCVVSVAAMAGLEIAVKDIFVETSATNWQKRIVDILQKEHAYVDKEKINEELNNRFCWQDKVDNLIELVEQEYGKRI